MTKPIDIEELRRLGREAKYDAVDDILDELEAARAAIATLRKALHDVHFGCEGIYESDDEVEKLIEMYRVPEEGDRND